MTAQEILAWVESEGFKLRNINGSVRFMPRPDRQPSEDIRRAVRQNEPELVLLLTPSESGEPTPLRPHAVSEPRQRTLLGQRIIEGIEPPQPLIPGIVYRATVNSWHGEPGDGKTTIALWAALELIRKEMNVLWFDEEAGPDQVAEKLEAMGAIPEELDAFFHYYAYPAFSMDVGDIVELHAIIKAVQPVFVVWDSAPDAFAASKVHEDSADEITQWMRVVATPLARDFNLALVLLDHVTKSAEGRNGHARGSGAKKAKMDGSFTVIKTADFDRNRLGTIEMKRAKNRLGILTPLVRFTVGGRDGELVCERHEIATEQREELSDRDRSLLTILHERFYREGAQTRELAEATGWKDPMVHRSRRALLAHACIVATGEGKSQRYAITAKGRATLGLAPAYTPPLNPVTTLSPPCQNDPDRVDFADKDSVVTLSNDQTRESTTTQGERGTLSPCHDPVNHPVMTGSVHSVTLSSPLRDDRVTGSDRDITDQGSGVVTQDEPFNPAVGTEPDDADPQLLWEWIVAVKAEREFGIPDTVLAAAVRLGCALDSFASAEDEATRLADYLDRHDDRHADDAREATR